MNNTSIYGLVDPRRPDWVMYVGKGLEKRVNFHWKFFVRNGKATNALLRRWFEQLKADGVEPSFIFLEENVSDWQEAEREWIAAWRRVNSQLCNIADGGNQWPKWAGKIGGRRRIEKHGNPSTLEGCIKGGKISVKKMSIETLRRAGHLGGTKNHKLHAAEQVEWGHKGGLKGGRTNVLSGHLKSISVLAAHTRWHVARGIIKDGCALCCQ